MSMHRSDRIVVTGCVIAALCFLLIELLYPASKLAGL